MLLKTDFFHRENNIIGKGENADSNIFSFSHNIFLTAFFSMDRGENPGLFWKGLKHVIDQKWL